MEVGAVVTSECESAAGLTNIMFMVARKPKHAFPLLYRLIQNGKPIPRSPEQGNGGGSGYCCVYLPDGSASLAPTRNGQLIKDMLSSLCEKRGFPLKDIVIYLQGKDKVGAHLLCTHHYRWAECSQNTQANSSFFLNTVAAAIITGPGLFCPQRSAGHFGAQSEVRVSQHFLPFIFQSLSPQQTPTPTPTSSMQHLLYDDMQDKTCQNLYFFHQWPMYSRRRTSISSMR